MARKETCKTCRWWDPYQNNPKGGLCRVRSPQHYPEVGSGWPSSNQDDWCGSYKETDSLSLARKAKLRELGETA